MKKKLRVGILGGTGMVGQRFIQLLSNHPWFEVNVIAASERSAGKTYADAVRGRWTMETPVPEKVKNILVQDVTNPLNPPYQGDLFSSPDKGRLGGVDFVFSALNLEKEKIQEIEEFYAASGIPVVSNNSAHRWTPDIPMIIPEINPEHIKLIDIQKKNRGWKKGFIAVKPNCSIQSYIGILTALQKFEPQKVHVTSLQAISGAGKTFDTWAEMIDNVIPFIPGEEEKSAKEPLKIWGSIKNTTLIFAKKPNISATCIRIPVSQGHMASVSVSFAKKPSKKQILTAIENFNKKVLSNLPSSPQKYIQYFEEKNRPQTKQDRDYEKGMGISMGRLEEDIHFDWKCIALSHNTIRGAAGGAILLAELLVKKGYIKII